MGIEGELETKVKAVTALLRAQHIGKLAWETLGPLFSDHESLGKPGRSWLAGPRTQGLTSHLQTGPGLEGGGLNTRKKFSLSPRPYSLLICTLPAYPGGPAGMWGHCRRSTRPRSAQFGLVLRYSHYLLLS